MLEGFHIGQRLARGRSYARRGQVLSINIKKGAVTAKVQGTRATPYKINITVKAITVANWKKLAKNLSSQALFAAKLLAGQMPKDIEKAFEDAGLSLFPDKLNDLKTQCSCPDWSNPCKHIAAVYYLLGEEFDRDPFLIFKLRGMSREEFVGLLGQSGKKPTAKKPRGKSTAREPQGDAVVLPEPPSLDASAFWQGSGLPDDFFGEVRVPPVRAALPKRLGNFPFWRGKEPFLEALEPIYKGASPLGMEIFLGIRDTKLNRHSPSSDR